MKLRPCLLLILALTGCVGTTTTAPDGTVTKTKRIEDGVLPFAGRVIEAYSPRRLPDRTK